MTKNNYSLEVFVNGQPIKQYSHKGKSFIEGRRGTEYTLKFKNNTHKKIMGVFSVDGLDVLKGEVASESTVGYIIDPFSSLDIKGFRIDETSVAAFKFSDTEKSYSNTQGVAVTNPVTKETTYVKTTKNNGTIGVRVYEEAVAEHDYHGYYTKKSPNFVSSPLIPFNSYGPNDVINIYRYSGYLSGDLGTLNLLCSGTNSKLFATGCAFVNNVYASQVNINQSTSHYSHQMDTQITACASAGEYIIPKQSINQFGELTALERLDLTPPTFDIGTSLGSKLQDKVKEVEFKRSENFTELVIYYASRESLIKFGIDFSNTKQIAAWPQAFEEKRKFCKVPDSYKG